MVRFASAKRLSLLILVLGLFSFATTAQAALVTLQANLTTDQEPFPPIRPSNDTTFPLSPSGIAIMNYDTDTNAYTIRVAANGLTLQTGHPIFPRLTDSHIHVAPVGVSGNVIVPFGAGYTEPLVGFVEQTFTGTFPELHEAALLAGGTYVNMHSSTHGSGEIRGQLIVMVPEPATMSVLGLGAVALLARRRRA
jgi:hypothetical protein